MSNKRPSPLYGAEYADEGCAFFPSCLRCPLPRCLEDLPGGAEAIFLALRDREIRRLREQGYPSATIAKRFGVSLRTAQRVGAA